MDPLQLSEEPIAYSVAYGETLNPIRRKLNSHISSNSSSEFNFSGQIYSDNKRQIFELGNFCDKDEELSNIIKSTFSEIFQSSFAAFMGTYRLERTNTQKLVVFIRCRLVKDSPGYFLGPHNDSTDTLFAFLLPIYESQQPTSAFRKIRIQSFSKSSYLTGKSAAEFVSARYGCNELVEIKDQFERSSPTKLLYCEKRKLLISVTEELEKYKLTVWRCRDLQTQRDEVLVLPNSNNRMYKSMLLEPAKVLGCHGVLPTTKDRINLLADVLCLELAPNQGLTGFRKNKDEIIFSISL